jgi:SPP1 family phage portal protein
MLDFTYELEQLEEGDRSPDLIKRIIEKHKPRAKVMKELYDRFTTKDLPIKRRVLDDPMKINNQINNDFFGEIINAKVGYFSGSPASYVSKQEAVNNFIKEFSNRNRLADIDAETTKWASVCGYAARMAYIDKSGRTRVVNVPSWEAILIGENGIDEPDYAIRYYMTETKDGEEMRVELYSDKDMTEYRGSSETDLHEYTEGSSPDWVFDYCPMWGYMNNEELLGDAERVLALIDAYDRGVSDVNSELEAFRSAYLALYGVEAPEEGEEPDFVNSGTLFFEAGIDGKAGKAEFVTKNIQDNAVENHLTRVARDIYKFSFTPDMSDEAFGGNVTGVAARYKILGLENKCAGFERKFKSGNIRMFEVVGSAQEKKNMFIDPYEIEQKFKRNFPQDLKDQAETATELKNTLTLESILAKTGLSDDPEGEAQAVRDEQDVYAENSEVKNGGLGEIRKETNEPTE